MWVGGFGFNGGSALAANGIAAQAFVNTDIAGSIAMCTWLFISWRRDKKPSLVGAFTGAVAGLACITPCAGFVPTWAAFIVGLLAGSVCYGAVMLRDKLKWDDALDVWGVHGVGGFIGIILLGVFASTQWNPVATNGVDGLLAGNTSFFLMQCAAVVISSVWAFVFTLGMLWVIDRITPVKVSEDTEKVGLDEGLHGETAYV